MSEDVVRPEVREGGLHGLIPEKGQQNTMNECVKVAWEVSTCLQ